MTLRVKCEDQEPTFSQETDEIVLDLGSPWRELEIFTFSYEADYCQSQEIVSAEIVASDAKILPILRAQGTTLQILAT